MVKNARIMGVIGAILLAVRAYGSGGIRGFGKATADGPKALWVEPKATQCSPIDRATVLDADCFGRNLRG